jgi:hypothetical protein
MLDARDIFILHAYQDKEQYVLPLQMLLEGT